jgi:hypothetical protein
VKLKPIKEVNINHTVNYHALFIKGRHELQALPNVNQIDDKIISDRPNRRWEPQHVAGSISAEIEHISSRNLNVDDGGWSTVGGKRNSSREASRREPRETVSSS